MKEHGLLLTAPMALARHERRKTQTRRLITAHNTLVDGRGVSAKNWKAFAFDFANAWVDEGPSPAGNAGPYLHAERTGKGYETMVSRLYPRIQVGDAIWWRETLLQNADFLPAPVITYAATPGHKCTNPHADNNLDGWSIWPWKKDILPGIHMPRWAARHVDTVVLVRPERIQDISEEDALAEGIQWHHNGYWYVDGARILSYTSAVDCYRLLFESINGPEAWERNDWVWVYEWKLD